MKIARVQTPDGRIARIEVPDGATDDQVLQFAASQFGQPEAASPPPQPAPSLTGEILEPTTKALLRGTAQATVGLPGAFIESAGAERLYGGKYEPDYRQKAIDVLRSEQLAIGLGPNEIQAPSESEIAQEAERQKVMGTFWREVGARMDKVNPREALIKDVLASIAVPVGRKMQDVAESATQSELLRDPYRETTPIGQRLREKPVQTVLTEGLEQLPNFAVSAGVGSATRGALGAGKAATFAGAGAASYVLEKGDIFNEGAEILATQHGGRDNVPPEAWDKLNYFAANHGAFNAALDAIAPSSQVNRAVLAKAGIERVMSKAGLKYVGKEFLKDFLLKELPQELVQEVSTIKAVEQATGRKLTDEEVLERLTAVGVGTILPVGAGSVSSSVANIRNAQPPAGAGEPEPAPATPSPQAGTAQPSPPGAPPAVSGITGAPRRVWTAKGASVDTNLMVVEADQLDTGETAPGALDLETMGDTASIDTGAPIIGPDGRIETGGDRAAAVSQAYAAGQGDAYRQWLAQNSTRLGIDPDQVSAMRQPVLVRARTSGEPLQETKSYAAETPEAKAQEPADDYRRDVFYSALRDQALEGQPLFEPKPGDTYKLKELRDNLKLEGVELDAFESKNHQITISKIAVEKTKRQQGLGSKAMNAIIEYADETRQLIKLSPSTDFGASSVDRLKKFYKRFGFVENKGINKDFSISESMYRAPAKKRKWSGEIRSEMLGYHNHQKDLRALAYDGDVPIGGADYSIFQGKPYINMVEVLPEHRRKGIAEKLIEHILETTGSKYDDIQWGMMTPEGSALKKSLDEEFLGTTSFEPKRGYKKVTDTPEFKKLSDLLGSSSVAWDMVSAGNKSSVDSLERYAKALTDYLESNPALTKPDSGIHVPSTVVPHVLAVTKNNQVLGAIIRALPIDVVDFLTRNKLSAEHLLSDETMLKDVLSVDGKSSVSLGVNKSIATSLLNSVASTATEIANLASRTLETNTTDLALPEDSVLGAHVRSMTETEAFSKWFGDSKVVDENGEPLVVYHGTISDFKEFRSGKKNEEDGIFFSPDPKIGSAYAGFDPEGNFHAPEIGSVMPVYLSLRNPLIVDFSGGKYGRSDAIKRARDGGHDGLIMRNHYDAGGVQDQFVVFRPEQIKSAIGNRGTFNPNDPNILNEPGPGDQIPITGTSTVALDTQRQAKGEGTDQLDLFTAPGERPVSNQQLRRIANETPKVGLVQTGTFRSALTKITNASEAAHVVAGIRKEAQENIVAVATDADGNVVGILRHSIGGPASVGAYPGILLGAIHSMPRAAKVWFAHNHPSGNIRQSRADKKLSDSLDHAMQNTGLEMMGMLVVAPNQKNATLYRAGMIEAQEDVPVQPGRRSTALPVTERKFIKIRQGDRDKIGNEQQAREQLQEVMGNDSGILLTDTQLRPLGYVPMTVEEMKKLRTGSTETGAGAVLRAVHEANATGAFVRMAAEAKRGEANEAADNMKGFFSAIGSVQLHDAFHGGERIMDTSAAPGTFFMNPIGPMVDSIRNATTRLRDTLGIGYGVKIVNRDEALDPGLLTPFLSPSTVANNYPVLGRYLQWGQQATEVQEKLRNAFGRRMHAVEEALGARPLVPNWTNADFKRNKTLLWQLMVAEDAAGARMSEDELRAAGGNDAIVHAHRLLRSAYDRALGIANKARAERGKDPINRREGYIPHFFHSYFIVVDGHIAGSARTLREAVRMGNPLARNGHKIRVVPKQFQFPGESVQAAVLGDGDYFRMLGKIEKDFSLTQEEAQEFLDGLARRRGRSRFVGNFLERKGVEGWEQNLDWAHRHYFNMISRYAALDQFKSKAISAFERDFGGFDKDAKGIARYIKNYINDINGNPTVAEELINASLAKVPALGKWLGAYFGDRPALQMASGFTNGVAIAKLGLYNVSAAVVNAIQVINTQTLIGPRWAATGMKRWARIEAHLLARRAGFETSAVKDIGLLKQMGVDVAMGLASGAGYSRAGPGALFRHSTAFFQGVERFNRATTGLGAYYKGRAEGRSHQHAIDYAKSVIERTQFDYSIAETPAFIRRSGPVGQVLFQFKKFPIKQMEFMVSLRGAEKARFWIPFFTLAGYYALPGIELLKNLIRDLFDIDMELEMKKWLMEWAGEDPERQAIATQIMRGILGHAGVDITKRVGAGDFIPSELKDLAGPGISSVVRAAQMAGRQEWIETLRAISTAPGNLVKAIANDGEVTDPMNRERSVIQLTPAERVMASVGFQPERVSLESDTARIIRYETQKVQRARKEIIDAIIEAAKLVEAGETEKADARLTRIMDRADRLQIGFTAEQMNREIEQKSLTRAQRAWINASPEIKARTTGVMEFHESRQPEAAQ